MRTVVAASAIGTTIEWYDFVIYATAAALARNSRFLSTQDLLIGTLSSIGTVGAGFFARPWAGDRLS
jgi:MHS family shikimate/dehydroshikimate transporter-like MFS transporter